MTTYTTVGDTQLSFDTMYASMAQDVLSSGLTDVGEWQAQKGVNGETLEVTHARVEVPISPLIVDWQWLTRCNLPWAEDHFLERTSGLPMNPPPSEAYWPYAVQGNAEHKAGEKFSHTYPERFWPRYARWDGRQIRGIRFRYGDYTDLAGVLQDNPHTRQAYLPIWFPEDIAAAVEGQRVPCSLGYHFLVRRGKMDVEYHIRSCDMVRHFRDDVYMAGRLVHDLLRLTRIDAEPGKLVMNIGSLHAFPPDVYGLEQFVAQNSANITRHLMEKL